MLDGDEKRSGGDPDDLFSIAPFLSQSLAIMGRASTHDGIGRREDIEKIPDTVHLRNTPVSGRRVRYRQRLLGIHGDLAFQAVAVGNA
jgi:hypothetical protein